MVTVLLSVVATLAAVALTTVTGAVAERHRRKWQDIAKSRRRKEELRIARARKEHSERGLSS